MKCPKCGYLGFETIDRCRNCGYDFSLTQSSTVLELSIRETVAESASVDDLALIDAAVPARAPSPSAARPSTPDLERVLSTPRGSEQTGELPLFAYDSEEDAPLVVTRRQPRPPLAVRRSTPEAPRVRQRESRAPMLDLAPPEQGVTTFSPSVTPGERGRAESWIPPFPDDRPQPATFGARFVAAMVDLLILGAVDAAVVYFTMQISGLGLADFSVLPKAPLLAFLLLLNGGYLVAFTVGGQTLGKMATGIKVVSARSAMPLDLGRSMLRTVVWTVLAAPAGLGFLTALFSADRRGLHDRCAGTRVVRSSA